MNARPHLFSLLSVLALVISTAQAQSQMGLLQGNAGGISEENGRSESVDPTPGPDGKDVPKGWQGKHPHHFKFGPYASYAPFAYSPAQIRHAYTLDQISNLGSGQTIGIVVAYGSPTAQNDLNVFCSQFEIPKTTLSIVYAQRKPSQTDAGWALETSLDTQWIHAMAPSAKIVLAVAPTSSFSDLLAAVNAAVKAGATVVSMSWGGGEFSSEANYESYFNKASITFAASSGDTGSGNFWPAASPSILCVGGTTLPLDTYGNRTGAETGWSGSGGGFSLYFNRPAYQNGWQANARRAFPDVALVADPNTGVSVYDSTSYNGQAGWWGVGGTSLSCPLMAASIVLANEQRVAVGKKSLTGSDTAIYNLAGSKDATGAALYGYFFNDVTAGSNGGFSDTVQFDEVTGLGSEIGVNLISSLKSQ